MFKALNGFLGIIVLILILRWGLPEVADLLQQILIMVFTLIRDFLQQIEVPR